MKELQTATFHRDMVEAQVKGGPYRIWPHVWGLTPCKKGIDPEWKAVTYGRHNGYLLIGRRATYGCAVVSRTGEEAHNLRVLIFSSYPHEIEDRLLRDYNMGAFKHVVLRVRDEPGYGYQICRYIEASGVVKEIKKPNGEWRWNTDVRLDATMDATIPRYVRPADAVWVSSIDGMNPQQEKRPVHI